MNPPSFYHKNIHTFLHKNKIFKKKMLFFEYQYLFIYFLCCFEEIWSWFCHHFVTNRNWQAKLFLQRFGPWLHNSETWGVEKFAVEWYVAPSHSWMDGCMHGWMDGWMRVQFLVCVLLKPLHWLFHKRVGSRGINFVTSTFLFIISMRDKIRVFFFFSSFGKRRHID
jgi:hypothetical protein